MASFINVFLKAEEDANRKQTNDTPKVNESENVETSNENAIRHRITAAEVTNNEESLVTDVILEASIQRSNKYENSHIVFVAFNSLSNCSRDKFWFAVIWFLVTMITLLIIRRCFFL